MFEYMSKNTIVCLMVDKIESVTTDMDNNELIIKMNSGDTFRYYNDDDGEIIEALYALTDKFRIDADNDSLVSRIVERFSTFYTNMQKMRK